MKFIINSLLFSKQIQSLSGVLTNSNTVPIINCFHFHLDEGMLTIRATDLETTLVSKVEVETGRMDDINDVAVPSKLLLDIIKSMDDVPMTFSVEDTALASPQAKANTALPARILRPSPICRKPRTQPPSSLPAAFWSTPSA